MHDISDVLLRNGSSRLGYRPVVINLPALAAPNQRDTLLANLDEFYEVSVFRIAV